MDKLHNVAMSTELHRRLKMRAAYQNKSIQEVTREVMEAGFRALAEPNIHDVARDSDPIDGGDHEWSQP